MGATLLALLSPENVAVLAPLLTDLINQVPAAITAVESMITAQRAGADPTTAELQQYLADLDAAQAEVDGAQPPA